MSIRKVLGNDVTRKDIVNRMTENGVITLFFRNGVVITTTLFEWNMKNFEAKICTIASL